MFNLERMNHNKVIIFPYNFDKNKIDSILEEHPKNNFHKIYNTPKIGFVNGLFATSSGIGGLSIIEVTKTYSENKLSLEITGHQGDIMKESVKCAKTIAWNLLSENNKKNILNLMKDLSWGLHVHTPDASTPKDGPSGGAAITTAILSFLINSPVKNDIAITGEIDLNGNIKKIGGLISKLSGAKKSGVKTVLIPHENLQDLEIIRKKELSCEDNNFNIILVYTIHDIIKYAFTKNINL
jgi:ATP-dependent Lon protease